MPEMRSGFGEFYANLRLPLHRRTDIDHFAGLAFRVRRAFQLQHLPLGDFRCQHDQSPMRVYHHRLGLL